MALLTHAELMSTDVDAPIRLSEESQDAAIAVPKATMHTQVISGVCGLAVRSRCKHAVFVLMISFRPLQCSYSAFQTSRKP